MKLAHSISALRLAALSVLFCYAAAAQPDRETPHRFDGLWDVVLSCTNVTGAMGYSFKFPATVKDSVLHAEKGTKGQPGWLAIDGRIAEDGAANFYADGLVGASEAAVGRRPPGTQYGYHIDARFDRDEGKGKRVEGRPCTVEFTRNHKDRDASDSR